MFVRSKPAANKNAKIIPTATANTGIAVDIIPTPKPEMITVAGPVSALCAIFCVGLYEWDV